MSRLKEAISDLVNRRGTSEVSRFALGEFVDAIAKILLPKLIHRRAMFIFNSRQHFRFDRNINRAFLCIHYRGADNPSAAVLYIASQ